MRRAISRACLMALAGCGQAATDNPASHIAPSETTSPLPEEAGPPDTPSANPASPTSSPLPLPTAPTPAPARPAASLPESEGPVDPKSVEAAAQVVQRFGALLEERKFSEARRLWSGAGQASGLSEAQFMAAYANYAEIHAEVGAPGNSEGGAGSIYVDVPLKLTGTLRSGGRFTLVGPVSLRRVNDVDGATAAQLRWHIFQSALTPRP